MNGFQKDGQFVTHSLLYLVTGEAAGNKDAPQETIRVNPMLLCKLCERVHVETVTAVYHRNGRTARHRVRRKAERERENQFIAIEQIHFARRMNECANELIRLWNDNRATII